MHRFVSTFVLTLLVPVLVAPIVQADQQEIAPGTGLQSSVVIDTGADGICNTTAAAGDIQTATVGGATPYLNEIRCGGNKLVETTAAGDDVQLIAFGATCKGTNNAIIDTGPNGIPETTPAGDDSYIGGMALNVPPPNTPCVIAGGDGVAQTAAAAGDDVQSLTAGAAEANTDVVLCGPNLVADTTANNFTTGDDVQLVVVGDPCSANQAVVDSGADGIATTRAEGPDLLMKVARTTKVKIKKGVATGSKTIKLEVSNVEFGASAPVSRAYKLTITSNSCGNGAITQLDADAATSGLQATANVPLGGKIKATVVASAKLEDVISVSNKIPFRCTFEVNAVAIDTDPDVDDAQNPDNNTTTVDLEVFDNNDL